MGGRFVGRTAPTGTRAERLAELKALLFECDALKVRAWFEGRSDAERREVAGYALRWFKTVHGYLFSYPEKPRPEIAEDATKSAAFEAAQVAWFASTNAPLALKRQGWRGVPRHEHVMAIARDRRPEWLGTWAQMISDESLRDWPLVRALVLEGLCSRPTCDGYTLGMIIHYSVSYRAEGEPIPTEVRLLEDPALFDDELWRIFHVEGNANASLTNGRGWAEALRALSADGTIPRERVLRETLGALRRDFAQHKAGFYSRFYDDYDVSDAERERHQEDFLALLSSRIGPTQSLALRELERLHSAGALKLEGFIAAASPALASTKSNALRTLRILEDACGGPAKRTLASCRAAIAAFDSASPDVHEAAVSLIEAHGDRSWDDLVEEVSERLDDVASSCRGRLQAWLGDAGEATSEADAEADWDEADWDELVARANACSAEERAQSGIDALLSGAEPLLPRPRRPWRAQVRLREALQPVTSFEALVDLTAQVVEGGACAEDIERMLAGISERCDERPENFTERSAPLAKRVQTLLGRVRNFAWSDMQADLLRVAQAWLTGDFDRTERDGKDAGLFEFWQKRALGIAERACKRQPVTLLSTPSHAGGWIEPATLVERAASLDGAPDMDDAVLALYRLAPEGRAEARAAAKGIPGEFGDALRFALGAAPKVGKSAELWSAAARSRDPEEVSEKLAGAFGGLGGEVFGPSSYEFLVRRMEWDSGGESRYRAVADDHPGDEAWPTLAVNAEPPAKPQSRRYLAAHLAKAGGIDEMDIGFRRWLATLWPAGRDGWYARGSEALYNNTDWGGAEWANAVYLETLYEEAEAYRPLEILCLSVGLTAKEPREVALATDALIAALEDGRVTGTQLGDTMRRLCHHTQNRKYRWRPRRPKAARWAKTLGEAAHVSPLHAEEVRIACMRAMAFENPDDALADQSGLMALLRELCAAATCGVHDAQTRAYLEGHSGSSKAAKLAKACLALPDGPSNRAAEARALALEARLALVEA